MFYYLKSCSVKKKIVDSLIKNFFLLSEKKILIINNDIFITRYDFEYKNYDFIELEKFQVMCSKRNGQINSKDFGVS